MIGPNGTGKWVVEVVSSQVVLSDTVYCTVGSMESAVFSVKCAVCSVQCTVSSVPTSMIAAAVSLSCFPRLL